MDMCLDPSVSLACKALCSWPKDCHSQGHWHLPQVDSNINGGMFLTSAITCMLNSDIRWGNGHTVE